MRALLLDAEYETVGDDAVIRLLLKSEEGFFTVRDKNFRPYFYVDDVPISPGWHGECQIVSVERVRKKFGAGTKWLKKIVCRHPREVVILREELRKAGFATYEADIPFCKRYLIDKGLTPMCGVDVELDGDCIREIRGCGEIGVKLSALCFDIEVYAPAVVPDERTDPIVIITCSTREGPRALAWGAGCDGALRFDDERGVIEGFCDFVARADPDIIVGYNSAAFDIPYLTARARALGARLALGRDGSAPELRRGAATTRVRIGGRIHIDLFHIIRLLAAARALRTQRYTLEEVYAELIGKQKPDIDEFELPHFWEDVTKRRAYISYALSDATATAELFDLLWPLHIELARTAQMPLPEVSGATSGQLVESLLISAAAKGGILIPHKPSEEEIAGRSAEPIAGGYVRIPEPGIYEKIAVLDFRSLYPTIIVARNISPETLNCGHEECRKNASPAGHHFCVRTQGFIPSVLKELIERRASAKAELRRASGARAAELKSKVAALKIITNSFYGMLRYARARWYTREGAEAVTAWGREYVRAVGAEAERAGFRLLYQDTDSIFLLMGNKTEEDVKNFMEKVNSQLPEEMELELEGIYKRGVFVAKKQEKGVKGAKKKYALIDADGKIKIRGFELVRRDWSKIARDTQTAVLEVILKEGSKERALEVVRATIERIRRGEVAKEDLTIYTQLRKSKYEVTSPELSAVEKARKRGLRIKSGSIIGYVVTKCGKGISQKAELARFAQDYDPEYYINNQIIPAVLKILGELGYSEDDIKYLGRQSSLEEWV